MSAVPGDFVVEPAAAEPELESSAPAESITTTAATSTTAETSENDIASTSSQLDISDEIEAANGLLKTLQTDASGDNTDAAEFEDAVDADVQSPQSERELTASAETHEASEPEVDGETEPVENVEQDDVAEVTEPVSEGTSQEITEVPPIPIPEESDLTEVRLHTSPSPVEQAAVPDETEKLEEVDLNEESPAANTETAGVTGESATDTEVEPEAAAVIPPPLPPRAPHKRSTFGWLTGKDKREQKESEVLPEEAASVAAAIANGEPIPPPMPPRRHRASRSASVATSIASAPATPANYELLLSRIDANREDLQSKEQSEKEAHLAGTQKLRKEFDSLRASGAYKSESQDDLTAIDWDFWTMVVADFANIARSHPSELTRAVQNGLPPPLRGTIWQLMASSKSLILEEVYSSLLTEVSPHEKSIRRDLSRTSFAKSVDLDVLFNIVKAYSLWDPEVGYIQGMAFIAVPLVMVMKEEEAFCLLVDLMKTYSLRDLFLPDMPGLHLKLYQFDRILEDTLPDVHVHLARKGVESSMYASQWFLTIFAYKFPLPIVLRIFDVLVAEGLEAVLRFGVALMRKNAEAILELEFDSLLIFLKSKLFDVYVDAESAYKKSSSLFKGGEVAYRVNDLVADAYAVKILPSSLKRYENEYLELHRAEQERLAEVEGLRTANGQLTLQIKRLESSLAALNSEHIDIANAMVQGKVEIEKLKDENADLLTENEELKKANAELQEKVDKMPAEIEAEIEAKVKAEMDSLMQRNLEVMNLNQSLEDQMAALEKDLVETKVKFASINESHEALNRKWLDIKKVLGDEI